MCQKVIALSGDYGYITPIETLIKSVVYNNQSIKFYLLNTNIPQEWFYKINSYLNRMGSQIINIPVNDNILANETQTHHTHINEMTFGRLLIPQLVPDDTVLYLDSDIIVDGSLENLFATSLKEHPLGAVTDVFGFPFNAGVLLLNNQKLKQIPSLVSNMLEAGKDPNNLDGDQTVLNLFFKNSFLPLSRKYNYEIGYDQGAYYNAPNSPNYFSMMAETKHPVIYHFASPDKPWNLTSAGRKRNIWWKYFDLDWSEIIVHSILPHNTTHYKGEILIFTNSDQLIHIGDLLKSLPNYQFHIASWTAMSPNLLVLTQFKNVRLYPTISGVLLKQLELDCDMYLNINRGPKELSIMSNMLNQGKELLSFRSQVNELPNDYKMVIIDDDDCQGMLDSIKNTTDNKEKR